MERAHSRSCLTAVGGVAITIEVPVGPTQGQCWYGHATILICYCWPWHCLHTYMWEIPTGNDTHLVDTHLVHTYMWGNPTGNDTHLVALCIQGCMELGMAGKIW
jgi:hypothetical protein